MTARAPELPLTEWTALQLLRVELDKRSTAPGADPEARIQEFAERLAAEPAAAESSCSCSPGAAAPGGGWARRFPGRYDEVLAITDGVDAGDLGSEPRILTASVRSEALAVTGNVVRALALGKQILAATASVQLTDHAVREIRGRFLLLLLLSGKFRETSVYLEETYSGAEPQTRLGGMFEIGQGVMDLHAGHLDDALSRLQAGRWQLRAQDPDALGGLAAAVCAYAAALQGEEEMAGLLLDDLAQAAAARGLAGGTAHTLFRTVGPGRARPEGNVHPCALGRSGQRRGNVSTGPRAPVPVRRGPAGRPPGGPEARQPERDG